VFFGESARRETVSAAFDVLAGARTLLVLGSSLTVRSGLRFVRRRVGPRRPGGTVKAGRARPVAPAPVRGPGGLEAVRAPGLRGPARRQAVRGALRVLGRSRTPVGRGVGPEGGAGPRFGGAAVRAQQPVVIVNDGPTRADASATVRVHGRIEDVLATWLRGLGA